MSLDESAVPRLTRGAADGVAAPARTRANPFHNRLFGWCVVALTFALWEWAATLYPSPGLPAPSRIWASFVSEMTTGDLLEQLGQTLGAMAVGYLISIVIGIVIGIAMARVKPLYALLEPFVELWRPIPSIIFIPVIILYLGLGFRMNVVVIVAAAAESIILNAYSGARSIPSDLLDTAATFRLSWWQSLREIVLPAAAPQIFVGMRIALAKSLVLAVGSGMIAGDSGIGYYIINAQQTLNIAKMYAGAATVAIVGYGLNLLFLLVESRLLHWDASQKA